MSVIGSHLSDIRSGCRHFAMVEATVASTIFDTDENSRVPVYELFVPGRVCLFGEHSDWVRYVLQCFVLISKHRPGGFGEAMATSVQDSPSCVGRTRGFSQK
jgi:hypothetical protein